MPDNTKARIRLTFKNGSVIDVNSLNVIQPRGWIDTVVHGKDVTYDLYEIVSMDAVIV